MTECSKVFLDTAPLIYFLDSDERYGPKAQAVLEEILSDGKSIVSSAITCTEYLVYPYRTHNQQKIEVFFEFMDDFGIPLLPINAEIAEKAAQIRARYKDFKTMDSLQLAAAVWAGCDVFLTNDRQLRQFDEIACITVEEWALSKQN